MLTNPSAAGGFLRITAASLVIALCTPAMAQSVDEAAAKSLAKKSDCFKCHTIDEKKDGPAWREVAKKYRGKADAEKKLYTHMTTAPEIEIDGEKEKHQMVKSKKEPDILNLVRFILSLPNP